MPAVTRSTDKKGRVTLPKGFEDHLVIIEKVNENEIRIRKASAIPVSELWLWKNPDAAVAVLAGLEEAKAGTFVDGPDLDADSEAFGGEEVSD
jgi:hypothetical protein